MGRPPLPFERYPCAKCGALMGNRAKKHLRFCSKTCSNTAVASGSRANTPKYCSYCGGNFYAKAAELYCSSACKKEAADRAGSTFPRYFRRLLSLKGGIRKAHLTVEKLIELLEKQGRRCAISGVELTCLQGSGVVGTNASIDRIDSAGTYEPGNVQLVCRIVNVMKTDLPTGEFLEWCAIIAGNNR